MSLLSCFCWFHLRPRILLGSIVSDTRFSKSRIRGVVQASNLCRVLMLAGQVVDGISVHVHVLTLGEWGRGKSRNGKWERNGKMDFVLCLSLHSQPALFIHFVYNLIE
ncbi:hypothetical protein F4808DRAFT_303637 [Astrocystis sublimbata]|nr:hypothetical protein F4808DRAFT_303637 [Astrocystis sublimbata]